MVRAIRSITWWLPLSLCAASCSSGSDGGGSSLGGLLGPGGSSAAGSANGGDGAGGSQSAGGSASIGGSDGAGGSTSVGGADGAGGSAGIGGSDGAGGSSGGSGGSAGSSGSAPVDTVCSKDATWAAGTLLSVSTTNDDVSPAITPDELSIAWISTENGAPTVHVADRASLSVDYAEVAFPSPSLALAIDRPALSPDGLRVGLVLADHHGFLELTRTTKDDSFVEVGAGTYAQMNQMGASLGADAGFGDPVLGADDRLLFLSVYGGAGTSTVTFAQRLFAGDPWPTPTAVSGDELAAQGAMRRHPTGLSSDALTLFYWDDVTGSEKAAFRGALLGDFDTFIELGAHRGACPNTACDALTYSATSASSLDLFRASSM